MATTTPNYGWTVPTSTDLVKDGATAIETLGDAIDASMNTALGTKKAGMVLLNTTSFSGVSSQALPANTFTSTYSNYRIIMTVSGSTTTTLSLRYRVGVTDTATGYYGNGILLIYTSTTVNGQAHNNAGIIQLPAVGSNAAAQNMIVLDVINPQKTLQTQTSLLGMGGDAYFNVGAWNLSNSTQYDSANIFPGAGTITGTISVYGYNV
jgi:hypothetical protein